ncbi:MAG TPA: hypothetical protein VN932_08970 [Rhizomicrobium sp.]|nr:hypothetical protein [Rhizomicrobium sp.]
MSTQHLVMVVIVGLLAINVILQASEISMLHQIVDGRGQVSVSFPRAMDVRVTNEDPIRVQVHP